MEKGAYETNVDKTGKKPQGQERHNQIEREKYNVIFRGMDVWESLRLLEDTHHGIQND